MPKESVPKALAEAVLSELGSIGAPKSQLGRGICQEFFSFNTGYIITKSLPSDLLIKGLSVRWVTLDPPELRLQTLPLSSPEILGKTWIG
jgi:hypothetical protein